MDSACKGKGQVKLSKVFHNPNKERKEKKKDQNSKVMRMHWKLPLLFCYCSLRFRCTFLLYLETHMEGFIDEEATDNLMI